MPLFNSPLNDTLPALTAGIQNQFSGVDPDWTQLAMAMGYRPNPYPIQGTQGQSELRFLNSLKNVMDQQHQGFENINTMPNYMYNMFASMAPLFMGWAANNPGTGAAPTGAPGFFSGGYRQGPLPGNDMSPLIQTWMNRRNEPSSAGAFPGQNPVAPQGVNPVVGTVQGNNDVKSTSPDMNTTPSAQPDANFAPQQQVDTNASGPEVIRQAMAYPVNAAPGEVGAPSGQVATSAPSGQVAGQNSPQDIANAEAMRARRTSQYNPMGRATSLEMLGNDLGQGFSRVGTDIRNWDIQTTQAIEQAVIQILGNLMSGTR